MRSRVPGCFSSGTERALAANDRAFGGDWILGVTLMNRIPLHEGNPNRLLCPSSHIRTQVGTIHELYSSSIQQRLHIKPPHLQNYEMHILVAQTLGVLLQESKLT